MSKEYGLIIPGEQRKKAVETTAKKQIGGKASIFNESSSDDSNANDGNDGDGRPKMKMKTPTVRMGPSLMERRLAKSVQQKALAEDPTIFQYDELYDSLNEQRNAKELAKSKEPKKAKYITKLLQTAERRKLENELRIERQVQKEREAEGEQFKDKEAFVTTAYRKKLEDMRRLEEKNARDDYLESIGDVTKQKDLDGFYRHIYEQKLQIKKEISKPELEPKVTSSGTGEADNFVAAYKPIKSNKQRSYRKRATSHANDEDDGDNAIDENNKEPKMSVRAHLTNNIDADSDFSIDESDSSSASEEESAKNKNESISNKKVTNKEVGGKKNTTKISDTNTDRITLNTDSIKREESTTKISDTPADTIALNLDSLKKENATEQNKTTKIKSEIQSNDLSTNAQREEGTTAIPKRIKCDIWRKRTVGKVFEDALLRYQQRRSQHLKS